MSRQAKDLLESAKRLKATPFGGSLHDSDDPEYLPIYQAYLVDRLNLTPPEPDTPPVGEAQPGKRLDPEENGCCIPMHLQRTGIQTEIRFREDAVSAK